MGECLMDDLCAGDHPQRAWVTTSFPVPAGAGYGLSILGLAGAVTLAWLVLGTRHRPLTGRRSSVVIVIAGLHAVVWVVRGVGIALGDRSIGFIVVHIVLAVVSVALAWWLIARVRQSGEEAAAAGLVNAGSVDEMGDRRSSTSQRLIPATSSTSGAKAARAVSAVREDWRVSAAWVASVVQPSAARLHARWS